MAKQWCQTKSNVFDYCWIIYFLNEKSDENLLSNSCIHKFVYINCLQIELTLIVVPCCLLVNVIVSSPPSSQTHRIGATALGRRQNIGLLRFVFVIQKKNLIQVEEQFAVRWQSISPFELFVVAQYSGSDHLGLLAAGQCINTISV